MKLRINENINPLDIIKQNYAKSGVTDSDGIYRYSNGGNTLYIVKGKTGWAFQMYGIKGNLPLISKYSIKSDGTMRNEGKYIKSSVVELDNYFKTADKYAIETPADRFRGDVSHLDWTECGNKNECLDKVLGKSLKEKEAPNIEVKHEGILEVPEGKNVDDLPLSHFVNLANKKGLSKITKALNNLQVWNKNDDPKLSKWAGDMIDKLNKKLGKNESAVKIRINESEMPYVLWVLDGNDNTWKMYKGINNAKTFINNNDYDEFLNTLNTQVYPNKTYKNNYIDWIVIPAGEDPKTFNVDSFYGKIEKESLTKEPNKSYWKFNQFEKDDYDDYKYYDKNSIRKFNLIPCENEDDCFVDENDNYSAWPVYDMADGDSTKPVYCTKREAYNYLLDLLNQSTYEQEYDL